MSNYLCSNNSVTTEVEFWFDDEFTKNSSPLMMEDIDIFAREFTQCDSPSSKSCSSTQSWLSNSTDTTITLKQSLKDKRRSSKKHNKQKKSSNEGLVKLGQIYALLKDSSSASGNEQKYAGVSVDPYARERTASELDFESVCAQMSQNINLDLADIYVKSLKGDFPYNTWSKRKGAKPNELKKRKRTFSEIPRLSKRPVVSARSNSFTEVKSVEKVF